MSDFSLFPENVQIPLLHPLSNEPTGMVLEVIGKDHDVVRTEFARAAKRLTGKDPLDATDPATLVTIGNEIYSASIVGWTNTSDEFKAVFKRLGFDDDVYTKEKAKALLNLPTAGWIRTQIDNAIADRESFFKKASNS